MLRAEAVHMRQHTRFGGRSCLFHTSTFVRDMSRQRSVYAASFRRFDLLKANE